MTVTLYPLSIDKQRARAKVAAAVLAVALALVVLAPATPASAHTSSYCGHESRQETADGAWWLVEYWSGENANHDGRQVHFHYYIHHAWNGMWGWVAMHDQKKHCGTWH